MTLSLEETVDRHTQLHKSLDELFACYITQNPLTEEHGKYTEMPFKRLLEWSHSMRWNPTCHPKHDTAGNRPWLDRAYELGWHRGFWPGTLMGLMFGLAAGYGLAVF